MIPVNKPIFISNEAKYLKECIDTGWISSEGPFVKKFEDSFSKFIGKKYGVAVSSGTSALEIAIGCLEIKPGDEVIMPDFTIISCPMAVLNYGGIPVFVDADERTQNMDSNKIEKKITKKTKAIMVVHMYGHPSDMTAIMKIAKKHKLKVIEDVAEAHGAEFQGKKAGSFGEISCFSFYANKIMNTGEGGMVMTNDKKYYERAKFLRNLGFIEGRRFYHTELARNYRMTNLQAAVGFAQVKNIKKLVSIKVANGLKYNKLLAGIKGIQLPPVTKNVKNVYWMYGIVLDKSTRYDAVSFAKALLKKGIDTRPFFYPMHAEPALIKLGLKMGKDYPVSKNLSKQGLYLPSGLSLTDSQIKEVVKAVKSLL